MPLLTRLIELLFVNRRLKTSRPYVFSALTGFAILALLGIFGTFLAAIVLSGLLWLGFTQMISAGLGLGYAVSITVLLALLILAITGIAAARTLSGIRTDIAGLMDGQLPLITPVVDKTMDTLGHVANAFTNGLRKRQTTPSPDMRSSGKKPRM